MTFDLCVHTSESLSTATLREIAEAYNGHRLGYSSAKYLGGLENYCSFYFVAKKLQQRRKATTILDETQGWYRQSLEFLTERVPHSPTDNTTNTAPRVVYCCIIGSE